jgi:hypothetical protein
VLKEKVMSGNQPKLTQQNPDSEKFTVIMKNGSVCTCLGASQT